MTASAVRSIVAASFATLATCASFAADAPAPVSAAPHAVLLRAAHLFDSVSGHMVDNGEVLVIGNKIVRIAAGRHVEAPAGAEVIDLGDATLLPGFIDTHVHLSGQGSDNWYGDFYDGIMRFPAEQALYGASYARLTLEAGFTSVRDVGSNDYISLGLRNAIASGIIPGPRMLIANYPVARRAVMPTRPRCHPTGSRSRRRSRACATAPTNAAPQCATRSSTALTSSSSCPRAACCRCPTPSTRRS
jgi:imidazolonepropionase-like amidohydrolase